MPQCSGITTAARLNELFLTENVSSSRFVPRKNGLPLETRT
jgi:hypothetical protein